MTFSIAALAVVAGFAQHRPPLKILCLFALDVMDLQCGVPGGPPGVLLRDHRTAPRPQLSYK